MLKRYPSMSTLAHVASARPQRQRADALARVPWKYRALVRQIRDLEAAISPFTDEQLRTYVANIRTAVRDGDGLDKHLARMFAAACVAARRARGMRPYNVQLIGAYELHRGRIAEMATGEGKTLVAVLAAALNAITGKGVHVVTVNDYLAQRDADGMRPVYDLLGLSVGAIVSGLTDVERRGAYRCDVVYGTNKEFGFDFLRDQIKLEEKRKHRPIDTMALLNLRDTAESEPVMRSLHYAIVDEADSVLIDEARMPLIIAGRSGPSPLAWAYAWADTLAARLRPRHDFELKPEKRVLRWRDEGRVRLQKLIHETSTPSVSGTSWQNLVLNALKARWLFAREQHYVISGTEVVIVDEFTGRRMPGRTWSEGLHQAVQAREKLPIVAEAETLARTSYQHFFTLYQKLAGMTGTARTEAAEFRKVYGLKVRRIPTHRPVQRQIWPAVVYRTRREQFRAVADEIAQLRGNGDGRPVLVGTGGIEDSEALSAVLRGRGIPHAVLNAKPENAANEARIVAGAGEAGAVTIATNMAGRGTDIKLPPAVRDAGGLHVIGTHMHESRRVDLQLVGRCARQGDPGSARLMLSLQDALLAHALDRRKLARIRRSLQAGYGQAVTGRRVLRLFALAQRRVEALHFRTRQQLMDYEDWLNRVYHQMGSR